MTCVAWDGRVLAVDRAIWHDRTGYRTRKLALLPRQRIAVAFAGAVNVGYEVVRWLERGARPSEFPESQRLEDRVDALVVVDGRPHLLQAVPALVPILSEQFAVGSGADMATMAMHLGLPAIRAVEYTCELRSDCGQGVEWAACRA